MRCIDGTENPGQMLASIKEHPVLEIAIGAFFGMSSFETVDLSGLENPTTINADAYYHTSIESIVIPDSVTSIKSYAFHSINTLKSIDLGNSNILSIENAAFANCESLTSFVFPAGITRIENSVLSGCTALESVTIPAGVTYIGDAAFLGCTALQTIEYEGTVEQWNSIAKSPDASNGMQWNYKCSEITVYCADGNTVTIDANPAI